MTEIKPRNPSKASQKDNRGRPQSEDFGMETSSGLWGGKRKMQRGLCLIAICSNMFLFFQLCILFSHILDLPLFFANLSNIPSEIHGELSSLPMFSTLRVLVLRCCVLSVFSLSLSIVIKLLDGALSNR